jgi:glutaredoxin
MNTDHTLVFVEIVAKKKGCMLCDLALAVLEEIAPEFEEGVLKWEVVDMGDQEGLRRHDELTKLCGKKPAVPSIVINERIAFDHIPEMGDLTEAVQKAWEEVKKA